MIDGKTGEEIRSRIMRVLFSDEIPDAQDCAIIALMAIYLRANSRRLAAAGA